MWGIGKTTSALAVCGVAAAGLWAAGAGVAAACSQPVAPNVTSGPLGFEFGATSSGLPRNVALAFWAGRGEPQLTLDGTPVELELLGPEPSPGHAGLATARTPLEPGRIYLYQGMKVVVDDVLDEEAPSRPTVSDAKLEVTEYDEGCGTSSCGERSVVVSARPVSADDRTPRERLTFALYLGKTAAAARAASEPERLGVLQTGETWFFADDGLADQDVFISISALDFAGNESERSDPVRIHSAPPSGCRAAAGAPVGVPLWIAAALVVYALRRRA